MKTTLALLAVAGLVLAALVACRGRDEAATDSAANDSTPTDGSAVDSGITAADTATPSASALREDVSRAKQPAARRGEDPRTSLLPSADSTPPARPEMPEVTPGKRPRTWRGFKLPEERPVRTPVDTIRLREQVADSVMKGDSTKPPQPDR